MGGEEGDGRGRREMGGEEGDGWGGGRWVGRREMGGEEGDGRGKRVMGEGDGRGRREDRRGRGETYCEQQGEMTVQKVRTSRST